MKSHLPSLVLVTLVTRIASAAPEVPFEDGFPKTAQTRIYELDEVKRGDRGVGYTVFSGSRAEAFDVEVLGVMEAMVGPGQDVILARLSGEKIEFTGVISGMSGSPVFIDGRLVGAVAYRFGQFTREPIAGITPIRSMLSLYSEQVGPPQAAGGGGTRALGPASPRATSGPGRPGAASGQPGRLAPLTPSSFRARAGDLPAWPIPSRPAFGGPDHRLRPISTPISVSGLDPHVVESLRTRLSPAGFELVAGGSGGGRPVKYAVRDPGNRRVEANRPDRAGAVPAPPIAPASPVAIVLMRGAVNASALCTVTMVERGRVYGCGHPFFGAGHVEFPMATAAVLNTVASEAGSWKQSVAAREVGIIDHDRLTAVAGQIGRAAPMVPVRVVVRRRDQAPSEASVSDVEIVDNPVWMPVMLESIVASAVNRRLGFEDGGTLQLRAKINVGRRVLDVRDTFSVPPPARLGSLAARDVSTAAGILASNAFARPTVRGIEVQAVVDPAVSIAEVVRVTADSAWARPGDELGVTVELKPYRGERRQVHLRIQIPATARKDVKVLVGGSIELDRRDSNVRGGRDPADLDDLIDILEDRRPAKAVFARVYQPSPGLRTQDTLLPDLPPTALATFQSSRSSGSSALTTESPGPEVRVAQPDVVVGSAELTIEIRP